MAELLALSVTDQGAETTNNFPMLPMPSLAFSTVWQNMMQSLHQLHLFVWESVPSRLTLSGQIFVWGGGVESVGGNGADVTRLVLLLADMTAEPRTGRVGHSVRNLHSSPPKKRV